MQNLRTSRRRHSHGTERLHGTRTSSAGRAALPSPASHVTTLAPASSQALPSLAEVPDQYSHEDNGELLYKLCAALVKNGLGSPETWAKAKGNCVAFAQYSIMSAIGAERGDLLQRNVEWHLKISDSLSDGYFAGDDDPPVERRLHTAPQAIGACASEQATALRSPLPQQRRHVDRSRSQPEAPGR